MIVMAQTGLTSLSMNLNYYILLLPDQIFFYLRTPTTSSAQDWQH